MSVNAIYERCGAVLPCFTIANFPFSRLAANTGAKFKAYVAETRNKIYLVQMTDRMANFATFVIVTRATVVVDQNRLRIRIQRIRKPNNRYAGRYSSDFSK